MRYLKNILKHPLVISLLVSCLTFLFIMGLRLNGRLEFLELSAYDWLIRLRPETFNSESPITLITITEKDILNQGRWPLSDETLTQVLSIIGLSRPCCIGLDI